MRQRLRDMRQWAFEHERIIAASAIAAGFFWDLATSSQPDEWFTHFSLISYFVLTGALILLYAIRGEKASIGPLPLIAFTQFGFAGIAKILLLLYGRSGTLFGSGVFIVMLAGFLIANEFSRGRYARVRAQIATWFMLLVPYLVLALPIIVGRIGLGMFLLGEGVALAFVAGLITLVRKIPSARHRLHPVTAWISVSAIAAVYLALYLGNVIPPVPLILKQIGVYHSLAHTSAGYQVTYEKPSWLGSFVHDTSVEYTQPAGVTTAYCFSSVFAPDRISTQVYHHWEKKQPDGTWKTILSISYPIVGGKESGYSGYSQSAQVTPGTWRCSVETSRGALIGRITFTVASGTPALTDKTLQ